MAEVDTSSYNVKPDTPDVFERMKTFGAIAQQKIAIDQAKFNLAKDHFENLANGIATLASDPALTPEKVQAQVNHYVKMGMLPADKAAQVFSQMPTPQQLAKNPGALRDFARQQLMQVQSQQQKFNETYGVRQDINNNNALVSGVAAPVMQGGGFRPATATPMGVGPGTMEVQRPELDASGVPTGRQVPTQVPKTIVNDVASGAARLTPQGALTPAPPQPVTMPVRGGVVQQSNALAPRAVGRQPRPQAAPSNGLGVMPPMDNGAVPSPQANARAPVNPLVPAAPAPAPAAPPGPYGALRGPVGMPSGAPQGSDAMQSALSGSQNEAITALNREAAQAPMIKARINEINSQLERFTTGPFATALAKLGAGANQISQIMANRNILPADTVAAAEKFQQEAITLQQQQAKALGGTVAALANSAHAVPSIKTSKQGIREVNALLNGMQDAITAKNEEYQKFIQKGGNPQDFSTKFEPEFNKNFEPRAFMMPYLTPDEQKRVIKEIPDKVRPEFFKRTREAIERGWIKQPSAQ